MKSSWLLAVGLSSLPVSFAQAVSTITISINTATDCPVPSASDSGAGGNGGVPSSNTPGVEPTIDTSFGTYGFSGFYPLLPSQSTLDGRSTVSDSMTLGFCASYCQGSPFFAVANGNECTCGEAAPAGQPVYSPSTSTPCPGNSAESCGSPGFAIVYELRPTKPGSTTIVYTSTNSDGQVTTGTTTSTFPARSSGVTTVVYTSTNSDGQITTGTTTSTFPIATPGVMTLTSTNSDGQVTTITTTSTSASQATDAVTSIVTETTTDEEGATITTSRTTVSTPTSPSALCPEANGRTYDTGGVTYEISCGTDYPGNDLIAVNTESLPDCLLACNNYIPRQDVQGAKACVAVSFGEGNPGGNCYLKYNIDQVNPSNGGFVSAKMVTFEPATPPETVSASSAQGGSSTRPPAGSSNGGGSPSTPTSGGSSPPTAISRFPCPDLDNEQYIIGNTANVFTVRCDVNYLGNDLITPHYDNFDDCIDACDTYTPDPNVVSGAGCVAVSWGEGNVGGNCYLKYAVGQIVTNDLGFDSAQTVTYIPPSPTTSTFGASSPSGSPSIVPTNNPEEGPSSPTDTAGGPSTTSDPSPSPTDPDSTTTDGETSPTTSAPVDESPIISPTASTTTTTDATSSPAYTPIDNPPTCPQEDFSLYTDVLGIPYNVNCGLNIDGDNTQALHADNLAACILYCDMYSGCAAVTYADGNQGIPGVNTNCYPYSKFRGYSGRAVQNALYTGVPSEGPNNGSDFQINLCSDQDYGDGSIYNAIFGGEYQIRCDRRLVGTELACMATDTLQACAEYCTLYDGCTGVTFQGTGKPQPNSCNCYPMSQLVDDQPSPGSSYALRIPQ